MSKESTPYRELLIGCGKNRDKKLELTAAPGWHELHTLDNAPVHNPDYLWDLNEWPLPFDDNFFDEIHAYEVLEHIGKQGDWQFFFGHFSELYRLLKNGGHLIGTVPNWDGEWAWGDPSHTRIFTPGTFVFLSQKQYTDQVGITPMSDFRDTYKADFEIVHLQKGAQLTEFVLQAIKPSRISV